MAVTLRKIDRENFRQCIELETFEEQRSFVASNLFSIAQSKVEPHLKPHGVYVGEEMVGFVMYGFNPRPGIYCIYRLMIDKKHQGKGYGRKTLAEVIGRLRAEPDCGDIGLTFVPGNTVAEQLYASVGFKRTGELIDDEFEMRLSREKKESQL